VIDLYPVIGENTLASHPVTASFIFLGISFVNNVAKSVIEFLKVLPNCRYLDILKVIIGVIQMDFKF
jgi:hypothetical protein